MNKQFNFHFQSSKPLNINKTNEITISSKETKTIKKNNRKHYKQTFFDKLKMNKALSLAYPLFFSNNFFISNTISKYYC